MPRFFAFLRAINVGRGRVVKMNVLRDAFESVGFSDVETFIASGNLIFETTTKNPKTLERKIEKKLRAVLGYEVATFIRTEEQIVEIARYKPFRKSQRGELNIVFLDEEPGNRVGRKLMALNTPTDKFRMRGREIYWQHQRKPGSPFSTAPLEKTIDKQFTIRSARTVKRIAEKYCSSQS